MAMDEKESTNLLPIAHIDMFQQGEDSGVESDSQRSVATSVSSNWESISTNEDRYTALMAVLQKLDQSYGPALVDNGYEDWESIQDLASETPDEIADMVGGFKKKYHRKKFMKSFQELNALELREPLSDDPLDNMEIECKCGSTMTKIPIVDAYENSDGIICDGCIDTIPMDDVTCFHCRAGKNDTHSGGYDYCLSCAKQELGLAVRTNLKFLRPLGFLDMLNFTAIEHKKLQVLQKLQEILEIFSDENDEKTQINVSPEHMMNFDMVIGTDVAAHMVGGEVLSEEEKQAAYESKTGLFWSRVAGRDTSAIVMLGKTGVGKSTACNRLAGDESRQGNKKGFETSTSTKSCTDRPFFVHMLNVKTGNVIAVVDLPGLEDSEQGNALFVHSLIDFFSEFPDGKKIFVMNLSSADPRFDKNMHCHFEMAEALFGNMFWKSLVILLTKMDLSDEPGEPTGTFADKLEECQRHANELNEELHARFEVPKTIQIPVLNIGRNNFVDAVKELCTLAAEADVFEHVILRTLKQIRRSNSKVEQVRLGFNVAQNVRQLTNEYEERKNREIESKGSMMAVLRKTEELHESGNTTKGQVPEPVVDSRAAVAQLERKAQRAELCVIL